MAYNPIERKCKISQYDQKDSRILYDADYDYYENLVGKFSQKLQEKYFSKILQSHPLCGFAQKQFWRFVGICLIKNNNKSSAKSF